jgi:hypothetical protein
MKILRLLVWKHDRFGRSLVDCLNNIVLRSPVADVRMHSASQWEKNVKEFQLARKFSNDAVIKFYGEELSPLPTIRPKNRRHSQPPSHAEVSFAGYSALGSKTYPIPRTALINFGFSASVSIFFRRRVTYTSTTLSPFCQVLLQTDRSSCPLLRALV